MTAKEFINKWNGKGIDIDGKWGYQCVDLFDQYLVEVIGVNWYPVVGAKDIWTNPNTDKYFDKIPNTPSGVPQLGDVVIWGAGIMGNYGHVAIATGVGNTNTFQSLDQNYPYGLMYNSNPAKLITHNYSGVIGWLRPKKGEQMASAEYNQIIKILEDRANPGGIDYIQSRQIESLMKENQIQSAMINEDRTTIQGIFKTDKAQEEKINLLIETVESLKRVIENADLNIKQKEIEELNKKIEQVKSETSGESIVRKIWEFLLSIFKRG